MNFLYELLLKSVLDSTDHCSALMSHWICLCQDLWWKWLHGMEGSHGLSSSSSHRYVIVVIIHRLQAFSVYYMAVCVATLVSAVTSCLQSYSLISSVVQPLCLTRKRTCDSVIHHQPLWRVFAILNVAVSQSLIACVNTQFGLSCWQAKRIKQASKGSLTFTTASFTLCHLPK